MRESWDYAGSFTPAFLERRRIMQDGLAAIPGVSWQPTGGGFFAFVRIPGCDDSVALATELLDRAHVVTIPGAAFGKAGEGYLRLSYGSVAGGDLVEAVRRLGLFLGSRAVIAGR